MLPPKLQKKLADRVKNDSLRSLPESNELVDLASNDYLGLSRVSEIAKTAAALLAAQSQKTHGAGGSRLLTGNHSLYAICEQTVALFHNRQSALLFNSGYDANVGLFQAVLQRGDIILYDQYVHASIRDGIQMSFAKAYKFAHNQLDDLEKECQKAQERLAADGQLYIVTESVFSMDGDSPDLRAIADLATRYRALLIVDEAHATGVLGTRGEGLVAHLGLGDQVFATLVTFGKAMGVHGAAILSDYDLRTYLINFARSLIYTTALPPHSVAMIVAAYQYLDRQGSSVSSVAQLAQYITYFKQQITAFGLDTYFIGSDSAIHVAVIPGVDRVKALSRKLQQKGYDVKPILSPTVPKGQERLRFCLHSFNQPNAFKAVLQELAKALK